MSTWTNITIPDRFESLTQAFEKIRLLEFQLNFEQEKNNHLYKELENIYKALKENKQITLTYEKQTIKAKLVE